MKINPLKSLVFRIFVLYALVFLVSLGFLLISTHSFFYSTVESQFKDHIYNDFKHLIIDYRDDGIEELRHDIRERREAEVDRRLFYFLLNPEGNFEYDQIDSLPIEDGWFYIQGPNNEKIIIYLETLRNNYRFAVGSDLLYLTQLETEIRSRLIKLFLFLLIFGLIIGLVFSRYLSRRLNNIQKVTNAFSAGDFSQRVEIKQQDELGLVANILNEMMSDIEKLIFEIKNVTTNLAHDLRTPLSRVRIKLEETLSLRNASPEVLEKTEGAIEQVDDLLTTFNSLLSLSEITNSKQIEMRSFNLKELLENIIEIYAPLFEDSECTVQLIAPPEAYLLGSEPLMTQLVVNLLENSISHNKTGINLKIEVKNEGTQTTLSVSDNGRGINPSEYEKIFKPFYKVDADRGSKGNGLGLSIVKAIADAHRAEVQITPEPSHGVRFSFIFPI